MKTMPKQTLSVGICAYNESSTILNLLASIIHQESTTYSLESIYVICDGSTDTTEAVVREFAKKYPCVQCINEKTHISKTAKLNYLYKINTSDLFLTFDADVVLGSVHEIDLFVEALNSNNHAVVAGGNLVPIKPEGFIPMIIYTNHVLWDETRKDINGGDHIANMYGSATLLKDNFSKTITYPADTTADEDFLYCSAKQTDGFTYAKYTTIYYRAPLTLPEFRLQHFRTSRERNTLTQYFGNSIVDYHTISFKDRIRGIVKTFSHLPLYVFFALLLNAYVKILPETDLLNQSGTWVTLNSTKDPIVSEKII